MNFRENLIRNENNETGNNTVWKNPPGAYGVSNGVGNRHTFNGHNRNSIGYAREIFLSASSGNPYGLENLTGLGPSLTGNHGQNRSLESSYRTHSVGVADVPQNFNEFYQQGGSGSWNNATLECVSKTQVLIMQEMPIIFYQHGGPVSQEKSSGYYGGNMGQIHLSTQNLYSGSTSPYMGDAVTHQQCYINAGNLATFQQSAGGYQAQNTDAWVSQANSGGYLNGNVGHYQQKYNEFQNTVVDSQASTSNTPDGKSVEDNCYNGTLEELDSFCKEGKVKETVEVFGLLDEKGISVDLNRYLLLMKVCGDAKALEEAKAVHEHVVRSISPLQIST
ncbi:hypothetical protein Ancab_002430 [Ancistrocladus abbreviatus]